MPIKGTMYEQNVACIYNRILLSIKEEDNPSICSNMNGPGDCILSEIIQSQKDKCCMILRIWDNWNNQIHRCRDLDGGFQGLGRQENGELLFNGCEVSVMLDEWD
jgi:hypothetical protein